MKLTRSAQHSVARPSQLILVFYRHRGIAPGVRAISDTGWVGSLRTTRYSGTPVRAASAPQRCSGNLTGYGDSPQCGCVAGGRTAARHEGSLRRDHRLRLRKGSRSA